MKPRWHKPWLVFYLMKRFTAAVFLVLGVTFAGAQYTWNSADYSKIFTLQGLYKNIKDIESGSFQLTGVWTVQLLDGALTFNGFADFWKEGKVFNGKETDFVFLTEPQLWYNFGEHFSAGTEIELANNFTAEGFKVCPTLAVKWTF